MISSKEVFRRELLLDEFLEFSVSLIIFNLSNWAILNLITSI